MGPFWAYITTIFTITAKGEFTLLNIVTKSTKRMPDERIAFKKGKLY